MILARINSTLTKQNFIQVAYFCSSKSDKVFEDFASIKEQSKKHWEYNQKETGHVYAVRPIKVKCKKGNIYLWCACGYSKSQPFCDGTHRDTHYKITLKPVPFTANDSKDYYFCACKQTKHRPLCDGSHKEINTDRIIPTIKY